MSLAASAADAAPASCTGAWSALLGGMPHAAWVVALDTRRVVAANAQAASLFGRPVGTLLGERAEALAASPEDLCWWDGAAAGSTGGLHSDTIVATADGRTLHVTRSIGLLSAATAAAAAADAAGATAAPSTHALVVLNDRSAEQRAIAERDGLLAELQATLESTADGILVTDATGRLRAFNRRFAEIWDVPQDLLEAGDDAGIQSWMARSVVADTGPADAVASDVSGSGGGGGGGGGGADGIGVNGIGTNGIGTNGIRIDGIGTRDQRLQPRRGGASPCATERLQLRSGRTVERVTRPLLHGGRTQGCVCSFRDLTERITAERHIESLRLQDPLTGLANRRALCQHMQQAALAARRKGQAFALLLVDLDRFTHINDTLGHDTGDGVLREMARRIQGCMPQDDLLARMAGDRFALLLVQADAQAAEAAARRVLNVVAQPCTMDGAHFTITCSIGMALGPATSDRSGDGVDDVVRHAETALRTVKRTGRASHRLHQARGMAGDSDRRSGMRLDHAMRQALVSSRFRLHYQPQVALAGGRIVGAEALLRWRDPELGDVPPTRFIPVAEDTGFIVAIGDWVLSQAVRQATLWHQRGHGLPIAVNVSALQFQQAGFVDRVAAVLAISGLPPRLLELELTESILVHDAEEALGRLHALSRLGIGLCIDDFGTGYSSLAYLKRFPIGKLKIDRSFISGLPGDESDAGIVQAILQMARALGKQVVAEGVETEAQRRFLQAGGCDQFQGFLFAPAMDSMSFEELLKHSQACGPPAPPAHGSTARMRLVRN